MKMTKIFATTLIIISALFSSSAFAEGAEFFANPFIGVVNTDSDGDTCLAVIAPPTNDFNDFIRINPNGETLLIFQNIRAVITIFTAAGPVFAGTGHFSATFHGFAGGKNQGVQFKATAQVTDGVIFAQAVCNFTSDAKGNARIDTIELH